MGSDRNPPQQGLKEYRKVIFPECPAPLSLLFLRNELGGFSIPLRKFGNIRIRPTEITPGTEAGVREEYPSLFQIPLCL